MSDDATATRPPAPEQVESQAATPHPVQFTIRTLLAITTAVAFAGAVARVFGLGTLVFSMGAILLLLNGSGLFRPLQSGRLQRACAGAVTCLFACSLFLPAAKGCNNSRIKGWETALMVVSQQAELIHKVATIPEERAEALQKPLRWLTAQWFFSCLTLGNVSLATALLAPCLLRRSTHRWYPPLVAFGATACWLVAWGETVENGGLLVGFWVWTAATWLLVAIVPMPRRAIAAAFVSALVIRLAA